MRAHALHRVVASLHLSHHGVQLIAVKHAAVPNLPAGFRIKRRVIENDLTFLARLELLHDFVSARYEQHFAPFIPGSLIPNENRLWMAIAYVSARSFESLDRVAVQKNAKSSACTLLRGALPGSARSEEHTSELQSHSDLV